MSGWVNLFPIFIVQIIFSTNGLKRIKRSIRSYSARVSNYYVNICPNEAKPESHKRSPWFINFSHLFCYCMCILKDLYLSDFYLYKEQHSSIYFLNKQVTAKWISHCSHVFAVPVEVEIGTFNLSERIVQFWIPWYNAGMHVYFAKYSR